MIYVLNWIYQFETRSRERALLFTDFYSNGWTSDQGIASIFSSFPVFPYVAIINEIDKSRKLPCLNKSLKNYHSSFFYGGQLTFGNIKSYLISHGFVSYKYLFCQDSLRGSSHFVDRYMAAIF